MQRHLVKLFLFSTKSSSNLFRWNFKSQFCFSVSIRCSLYLSSNDSKEFSFYSRQWIYISVEVHFLQSPLLVFSFLCGMLYEGWLIRFLEFYTNSSKLYLKQSKTFVTSISCCISYQIELLRNYCS